MTDAPAIAAPAGVTIRPTSGLDLPFILDSWSEAHRRSRGMHMGPDVYARLVQPTIKRVLNRDDVWIVGAYGEHQGKPDAILGWLAWTAGPLPAVHFCYVRGAKRGMGIGSALLREAMIGKRFLYTFKGQLPKYGRKNKPTADEKAVASLARRGVAAVHVSIEEWLEGAR